MIIRVLQEVANNRLLANNSLLECEEIKTTIQLSRFLMSKFVDEINVMSDDKFKFDTNEFSINWNFSGVFWVVYHRYYRDDTNDQDVEEVIYELLKNLK